MLPLPTRKPSINESLNPMSIPPLSFTGGAALGGTAGGGTLGNVYLDQSKNGNIFSLVTIAVFAGVVIWLIKK